jgi:GT2 family glycosyltransferase
MNEMRSGPFQNVRPLSLFTMLDIEDEIDWSPDHLAVSAWLEHVPFAFWIIKALRPGSFVELGTHYGVSYAAFCQAVQRLALSTRCHAVDTWEGDPQSGAYGEEFYTSINALNERRYRAFSTLMRMTFDEARDRFGKGGIDLLHIGGYHTYDAVSGDFDTWRAVLSERAVVLLHDINLREGNLGVRCLWQELQAEHAHFEFVHGYGLGVLGLGKELPALLKALFAATSDPVATARIRDIFATRGDAVRVRYLFQEAQASLAAATAEIERLRPLEAEVARLRSLEQEIADLRTARIQATKDLAVAQRRLNKAAEELADAEGRARTAEATAEWTGQELRAIQNSRIWRTTRPYRAAMDFLRGRLGRPRLVRSRVVAFQLCPANDLVDEAGWWVATGDDPYFLLMPWRNVHPRGWSLLRLELEGADVAFDPRLYVDDGAGFRELTSMPVATLADGPQGALIRLPDRVDGIRLDPLTGRGRFRIRRLEITQLSRLGAMSRLLRPYLAKLYLDPSHGLHYGRQAVDLLRNVGLKGLFRHLAEQHGILRSYTEWVQRYDTLSDDDRQMIAERIQHLPYQPLISVLVPAYETPPHLLERCIESVRKQLYPNWQLCLVDDASPTWSVRAIGERAAASDPRIVFVRRDDNGHIAAASNTALALAIGEFTALLDHDDELPEHALYMIAEALTAEPRLDIIFSDEDKIDNEGVRFAPYFKSDWNPELMLSQNAVSHFAVYRTSLLREIKGFREGFEGSQDWDMTLRAAERVPMERIKHLPFVLYHWRATQGSAALSQTAKPYAYEAAKRAIQEHLDRSGSSATAERQEVPGWYRVRWNLPNPPPRVTLIIPTRDKVDLLRTALSSILEKTTYPAYEILVVDNGSEEQATSDFLREIKQNPRVRVLGHPKPYNYAEINNIAAAHASGELLALVNNDTDVIGGEWLSEMVSLACRPEVGAVGAKLIYPNDTIQHAGVVLGLGGVAGHAHDSMPRSTPGYFARAALTQQFSAVTAACMVLRRAVFEEVGGFDADAFAVAFNDVDLCLRIGRAGYRIVWTPFAELYHHESASVGRLVGPERREQFNRECQNMRERWQAVIDNDPFYNPNLTLNRGDFSLAFPPRVAKPWLKQ